MVERLFLAVPRGCLQFVIVVFPDHTHLLFLTPLVLCSPDSNPWPTALKAEALTNGLSKQPQSQYPRYEFSIH